MAALYAAAILVLTVYGANLLWLSYRHARSDTLVEGSVPDPDAPVSSPAVWPRVTVQVPLYNEPLVAGRVIDACAGLDYPRAKLEIQILDDSTDEIAQIGARRAAYWRRNGVDMVHVRRVHREGFKAGALENGLRLAHGEFLAVFDADFVPPSDFLRRLIPPFSDDRLGVVQARWGHLNAEDSLLTRVQAFGLDTHFAIEQRARYRSDCFLNFNGTAGIWRRTCIEAAGGWDGDTIAEDLDLSYRAQLAGWRLRFFDDVDVPAEVPSTMEGLRTQQFRWAKGSVETAIKLLRPLWSSSEPMRRKVQGTLHMTAHVVFPFILLAALLHPPLLAAGHAGAGPGTVYFGWMAVGLIGFVGFCLAQVLAQRHLYAHWLRRLVVLPAFMAGTIGFSINNTRAVLEALAGRRTPFIRTPKFGRAGDGRAVALGEVAVKPDEEGPAGSARSARPSAVQWLEVAMLLYSLGGVTLLAAWGEWAAVPFQLLFAGGFGLVVAATVHERMPSGVRS